MHPIDFQ